VVLKEENICYKNGNDFSGAIGTQRAEIKTNASVYP